MMIRSLFPFLFLLISIVFAYELHEPHVFRISYDKNTPADEYLRPYHENPWYWEYQNEPILLIGGTGTDNLFQWTGQKLIDHLDLLESVGGNYVRNTMSDRSEGDIYAFREIEEGLYDLDKWNEEYWNRLTFFLEETSKRGIIVQISLIWGAQLACTPVGNQGHFSLEWPWLEQAEAAITTFVGLGLDVMITELDIDVLPSPIEEQGADISVSEEIDEELNPYVDGLPDSVQQVLTKRYTDLFEVYYRHRDVITRITFWGVSDGDFLKNNWPVRGRTNYPLLFDRDGNPKPAFYAVSGIPE